MATSIFFNGRLISVPGSYSEVDASGLESVGLGASGIVAVLGTAVGGKPASEMSEANDFLRMSNPTQIRDTFISGDLREVGGLLFEPAKDENILAGAAEVIPMKVNPDTQGTATLANTYGDCLVLTSLDYGPQTGQVNVSIANGTNQGKLVTLGFEDVTEAGDDVGGDAMFYLKYVNPGTGWDTMTAEVESSGAIVCKGTRAELGLAGDITTQMAAAGYVEVVSASSGDTTQQCVLYGLNSGGTAAQMETVNLNGTTEVTTTQQFSEIHGARIIGTTAGIVTIQTTVPATIMTLAAGANTSGGLHSASTMYVGGGVVTLVADAACTDDVLVVGKSLTGVSQIEQFTLNGTTSVVGTAVFSEITYLVAGDLAVARTVTASADAGRTAANVENTIQKCADYFNNRSVGTDGFIFTLNTGLLQFDPDDLDTTTGAGGAVSCLSPADPAFYANLWAVKDWINNNSQYASADYASGAVGGAPSNTTAPVFLSGGTAQTPTSQDWQDALNLLKKVRVNSIVVLTPDPAVHAMLDAHCAYMCGAGRNERDGFVGIMNAGMTDLASKTEIKSQIVDLNTRHIRAFAQNIERYNSAGEREVFSPCFQAAVAAGMQAGSTVGVSLTYKYMNVLGLEQDSTWNPTDDAQEMIQAGLCFAENVEGVGRRWVRNVTTHLTSNNLAYIEGSVNEAVNFATYNFRTNMEASVGKRGFSGTINAAKGVAVNTLGLLVNEEILVAWQALSITSAVDVLTVSCQIAPVIPINFVRNTLHLVTIQQTAA
jgi:hypothetical protein